MLDKSVAMGDNNVATFSLISAMADLVSRGILSFHIDATITANKLDDQVKEFQRELGIYGQCECCGRDALLFQDHDHLTDLFRGKICRHCNTGLGFFRDDLKSLEAAIEYLRQWRKVHFEYDSKQRKKNRWRPGKRKSK